MYDTSKYNLNRYMLSDTASVVRGMSTYACRENTGPEITLVARKFGVLPI